MNKYTACFCLYAAAQAMCRDKDERVLLSDFFNKHWQIGEDSCYHRMVALLCSLGHGHFISELLE